MNSLNFSSLVTKGALEDLRILDLSRVLAGPWCTQVFGDLGAKVIKVERSPQGDETRQWGPPFKDGISAYYMSANRNKEVLLVDFKDQSHLKKIKDLAKDADIVIENFKEGGLETFGLDYDSLKGINPEVIYCSIRGFSSQGPYKDLPGYDALIQAMAGMMSITGEPDGSPVRVGSAVADLLTGLYAGNGILAAYIHRLRKGEGQKIEVSLFETQVQCLANVLLGYLVSGKAPQKYGTAHPNIVPYQAFKTKDHWIMLAIGNDGQFKEFCNKLGVDWFQDNRFHTNPARVENREELIDLIDSKLITKSRDEWANDFEGAKFPWGPLNSVEDLSSDPHVLATNLFDKMDDSDLPRVKSPIQMSKTPITAYKSPRGV